MIIGIPLACQHHKRDSGCKFGEKCELRHAGWQSAQQKAEEKWWKRNCCFIEEFEASVLRVPLFRAAEIQVRHMSERGPYAPNVKRELTKKTLPQERYAAGMHGKCRTMSTSSKRRTKPHSTRLQKFGHYQRRLRRKIFCGGFRILTTINTVNGVVQTNEEATVYVNDLEWCATIEIFEDTLADLSQGKLYEDLGYSYDLASGQNTSYQRGRNIQCNTEKLCNNRCPRIIDRFFQFYCKYISCVVNAGLNRNLLTSKYHLHWEASQQILQKPKSKIKQGHCTDTVRLVARFARGARGIHRKSRRRRSVSIKGHTRNTSQNSDLERPAKVVSRKHSFFFLVTSRTTETAMYAREPKITRALCRKRTGDAVLRSENLGDLITADHKVFSEGCEARNNHRYAVVVQATQRIQSNACKTKNFRKHKGACKSSWSRIGSLKSFTLTIPWNLAKACEDLSWNHCTSTHRSGTNGIAEGAVRRVKECTSVLLQSGLDEKWWADSMECHCYLRKMQDLFVRWEKHLVNDDSANHTKDQSLRLVRWSNIAL